MAKTKSVQSNKNQLVITFLTRANDNFNLTISNVKPNVSEDEIRQFANHIVENRVIVNAIGGQLMSMVKAKVVASETDTFDLIV